MNRFGTLFSRVGVWPACFLLASIQGLVPLEASAQADQEGREARPAATLDVATFGAGCFWCTEAVFERVRGVEKVVSGYSGGAVEFPTYQQVCSGQTGHAEVVQITFDPRTVSYADLLKIFWKTHDPTTLNRQGPDRGTQYRSVVFYHNDQQRRIAEQYKRQLDESKAFRKPIVTEITAFSHFYPAEQHHQDYFELNRRAPYCQKYIGPKIESFNRLFPDQIKRQGE